MNLPRKWEVLDLKSTSKKYYYGVDFSKEKLHYSLYVTDFSNVWISDVDEQKLHYKAIQNGIEPDSIGSVYHTLLTSFENNFNGEDAETKISIDELKMDKGVPLELRLNMVKIYTNAELNWNFDLVILPDSSAITILRNLIFHLSTIIFSLNEYKNDLVNVIERKDSAIRYLGESIEGMNGGHLISKWAPKSSSNAQVLHPFEKREFDNMWKKKKLNQGEDQYIWNVLSSNTSNDTWDYSKSFRDQNSNASSSIKNEDRKKISDSFDEDFENVNANDDDDTHARHMDSLTIDEHNSESPKPKASKQKTTTDTDTDSSQEPFEKMPTPENRTPSPTKETSRESSTPLNTQTNVKKEDEQEGKPEKQRPKRHFGAVSRKRKVSQSGFSPIKAQKLFHSED